MLEQESKCNKFNLFGNLNFRKWRVDFLMFDTRGDAILQHHCHHCARISFLIQRINLVFLALLSFASTPVSWALLHQHRINKLICLVAPIWYLLTICTLHFNSVDRCKIISVLAAAYACTHWGTPGTSLFTTTPIRSRFVRDVHVSVGSRRSTPDGRCSKEGGLVQLPVPTCTSNEAA